MNILQAKEEIKHTIQAYLMKDEFGQFKIPSVRQRPVLLMGPPGIGKTAIMEQIARECHIGLVAYTITHHTRQSAIGLPYIQEKEYGGKKYSITEYTMSEIIASVYDKIEQSGLNEGILFIDEINCVSETLAPMMLQFLQGKSFGNHKVPEGWVIVAAGNPPEYNKSVRDFDIVTLDRVKKIDVKENFDVWKSYGYQQNIHGAIMTYLEIKKENFYTIEMTVDGRRFVTARGWEDLSEMLYAYEALNIPVEESMIIQYIQHPKLAKDFANYYDLYKKYETSYNVEDILNGKASDAIIEQLKDAYFDEKVSVIGLLVSRLNEAFMNACRQDELTEMLFEKLKQYKEMLFSCENSDAESRQLSVIGEQLKQDFDRKTKAGQLDKNEQFVWRAAVAALENFDAELQKSGVTVPEEMFEKVKELFGGVTEKRSQTIENGEFLLNHAFDFLEKTFGESQEMVIFLTELNTDSYALKFIQDNGNDYYFKYNKSLLFGERRRAILSDIEQNF